MTEPRDRERLFATEPAAPDGEASAAAADPQLAAARAQLRAELDQAAALGPEPLEPFRREGIRSRLVRQLAVDSRQQSAASVGRLPVLLAGLSFGVIMIGLVFLLFLQATQPLVNRGWLAPQPGVEAYVAVDGSQVALTTAAGGPRLRLDQGRVIVRYRPTGAAGPLTVETPIGDLMVRGTVFSVNVDAERLQLAVREGLVEASDRQGGRWRVGAGRQLVIPAEGASRVRPGLYTPLMREIEAHFPSAATTAELETPSPAASHKRPGKLSAAFASGSMRVIERGATEREKWLTLPLEHTDVQIDVSGFVARAQVTQKYGNPFTRPIEAVYVFPLPENAAVDSMTMTIGERTIRASIERRERARELYEKAKAAGQRAALLEQERPNVFTQAVANIMPGDAIEITLTYVDLLTYRDEAYELVFPMVVGPRYTPGSPTGASGVGSAPDTDRVPDGSRTTPPVLAPNQRSSHDIALSVSLDAGVELQNLYSPSHALDVWTESRTRRRVRLSPADTLPNKDFVLRYETAGETPQVAVMPHHDERGGFFTLLIQPQREVRDDQTVPRELIFIVDTSGSMRGFPLQKSKEAMRRLLRGMRSADRFNIVRFAGGTGTLWGSPQPYTAANLEAALAFLDGMRGSGGTEMAAGITRALEQPAAEGFLRIAFLLTDGLVDEAEVLSSIRQERQSARVFTLGVGSSPNRNLLDRAAILGRGEAFYLRPDEISADVIDQFFERVDRPALTNVEIDWGSLDVHAILPERLPDLFAGQPLLVHGRYIQGGESGVRVRGQLGGEAYEQRVDVDLPIETTQREALASIWARRKIKGLNLRLGAEPKEREALVEEITATGLEYRLLTKWTSFVAVEERITNVGGRTETIVQPVELPEDLDYGAVFAGPEKKANPPKGSTNRLKSLALPPGAHTGHRSSGLLNRLPASRLGNDGDVRTNFPFSYRAIDIPRGGGSVSPDRVSSGVRGPQVGGKVSRVPSAMLRAEGNLDRDAIQKVINKSVAAIQRCYERELLKNPKLGGKLLIEWVIAANGRVRTVRVKHSTLGSSAVERCIVNEIKRWRFPKPRGGDVTVTYPFFFKATGP